MAIRTAPRKGTPRQASRKPSRPKGTRGFFRRFWWLWAVPLLLMLGMILTLTYVYARIELPDAPPGPLTSKVYDVEGRLITTLHAEVDRSTIPFRDMPQHFRQAVIAIEDKDFYDHKGVSPLAILRAAIADLRNRRIEQGGSTITQQYVKNVYTGGEKSFLRKIKEGILALKLERKYNKGQILHRYLNTIYFGRGAYGVQAAARFYFDKPAKELTVAESAVLAGVIAAPETYNPVTNPEQSHARRNLVLDRMATEGYISAERAAQLKATPLKIVKRDGTQVSRAAYFVDHTSRFIQKEFGSEATFTGGLRVRTTLDLDWQAAAEKAIRDRLPTPGGPAAALVSIDVATGEIRAMVGGRDFRKAKFNLATQARRQAGSAMKTFGVVAAFEKHLSPHGVWSGPSQIRIDDPRCQTNGEAWEPSNAGDSGSGTVSMLQATARSVNTVFAQLVTQVGPESVAEVARRMGIQSPLQPVCAIVLGSQDVKPLEMTAAYATLASRGIYRPPIAVREVKGPDGSRLPLDKPKPERAIRENDADLTTYALEGVVQYGTGTAANIGRPVAGKTGTSQSYADAWFCGYTPQVATCVWMGYPGERKPMEYVEGYPRVFGGTLPALIWHDFMAAVHANLEIVDFHEPSFDGYDVKPFDEPADYEAPEATVAPSPSPAPSPTKPKKPKKSPKPPSPPPSPSPSPSGGGGGGGGGNG